MVLNTKHIAKMALNDNSRAQSHSFCKMLHSVAPFGAQRLGTKLFQTCCANMTLRGAMLLLNTTSFTKSDAQQYSSIAQRAIAKILPNM